MKITYDPEVDVLRIVLRDVAIEESEEAQPGMIFDFDSDGNVVGIEILSASTRIEKPEGMEYTVTR